MALIVLNVLALAYWKLFLSEVGQARFLQHYALSLETVRHGAWWQFITYQFLHGSWIHLILNLLFLHSLGPVLEETLGKRRYLFLYLASGAFGGAVHLMGSLAAHSDGSEHPVVGASASLCGLLAALCALYSEEKMDVRLFFVIPLVVRAKFLLLIVALVSIGGIFLPFGNVAHFAHFGGLVGGLICLNLMKAKRLTWEPYPEAPPK